MKKALKKWIHRVLHSTLKGGLHEQKIEGNMHKRIRIVLRMGICHVGLNKMRNKLKPIYESDILKMMGYLIVIPSLTMGFWIFISILLGIPNDILRASLIWLFIFLLFSLQGFILIVIQHRHEGKSKSK